MTSTDTSRIETFVQYVHLDKLYGHLPGMRDAVPAVFGLTPQEYASLRDRFATAAADAARGLLDDPGFVAGVDALPWRDGQTVLAVGDSITDDLQSWTEILAHVLRSRRPGLDVRLVNGGLSAHTTSMILRRWPATAAAVEPDWVLCALGGNDVTRVGPEPTAPQVPVEQSVANLRRMQDIAPQARWVWLTPVPVDEERVRRHPPFRMGGSRWRNDDVRALATAMRALDGAHVDLVETFGVPTDPELQGDDGVHPTVLGQAAITRAVVRAIAGAAHGTSTT